MLNTDAYQAGVKQGVYFSSPFEEQCALHHAAFAPQPECSGTSSSWADWGCLSQEFSGRDALAQWVLNAFVSVCLLYLNMQEQPQLMQYLGYVMFYILCCR